MRTVAHLYDDYSVAQQVVSELEASGFSHDHVSLIANQSATSSNSAAGSTGSASAAGTGTGTGASVGTLVGGGAGLLAGIGALAIPGVGPVVAAGWLVATLTGAGAGAAAGGLLGSLAGAGVPQEHAHVYAEGVRRGGSLVTVRAEDMESAKAEAIMLRHNPADVTEREASYRSGGNWSGFDATRPDMTADEMAAERKRLSYPNTTL